MSSTVVAHQLASYVSSSAEVLTSLSVSSLTATGCTTWLPPAVEATTTSTIMSNTVFAHLSTCSIVWSQLYFSLLDSFFYYFTQLADPVNVFCVYVPAILYFYSQALGLKLLIVLPLSDICNALLKFAVSGDRPYWSSKHVREFGSITCERSWGMPSGHAMVATAVMLTIHNYLAQRSMSVASIKQPSPLVRISYIVCTTLVALICWSRLHVGAHYLGQVIAGSICGYCIYIVLTHSRLVDRVLQLIVGNTVTDSKNKATATTSTALAAAAMAMMFIAVAMVELAIVQRLTGADPLESLSLATSGCGFGRAASKFDNLLIFGVPPNAAVRGMKADSVRAGLLSHATAAPLMSVVRDAAVLAVLIVYIANKGMQRATGSSSQARNDNTDDVESQRLVSGNGTADMSMSTTISKSTVLNAHMPLLPRSVLSLVISVIGMLMGRYIIHAVSVGLIATMTKQKSSNGNDVVTYAVNFVEFGLLSVWVLQVIPAVVRRLAQ